MADLIARWPSVCARLARRGMACVGCPMARFETLGEAAAAYGFDPQTLLREIAGATGGQRGGRRPLVSKER